MQIEVLYDPYGIGKAAELDLADPGDYWFARKVIEDARREDRSLSVRVRPRSMVGWFDDLRDEPGIVVRLLDPLEELRGALGVDSLPSWVGSKPGLVVSLGLLERAKDTPRFANEDAHSWVVRVLLGPRWCRESLDEEALSEVLAELAVLGSEDAFVRDLRAQRLSHWEKTSSSLATLLKWLKDQPAQHARAFAAAQAVRTYPKGKAMEWLEQGDLLASLAKLPKWEVWVGSIPSSLGSKELSSILPPSIAVGINEFILSTAEQQGIRAALECLTGRLDVETTALSKVVRRYWGERRIVSQEDTELAKLKLSAVPEADALIEALEVLLPKEPPPPLSRDAPWEQVALWLVDEYIPYYAHVAAVGHVEDTELQVSAFEEWLLSNYVELHTRHSCLVHTYLQTIKQVLAEGPVLAVVVDGLGLAWQGRLSRALGDAGLCVSATEPRLSLVPTLTEASKPAMLAGQSPQQLEPDSTRPEEWAETLARAVGIAPRDVYVASDQQEGVDSICARDARLYLYL